VVVLLISDIDVVLRLLTKGENAFRDVDVIVVIESRGTDVFVLKDSQYKLPSVPGVD